MKIIYEYSHLGGSGILSARYPKIDIEIREVISSIIANRIKISKEKTKLGRQLYDLKDMNSQFKAVFRSLGYNELRDTYTITIPFSEIKIPGVFK